MLKEKLVGSVFSRSLLELSRLRTLHSVPARNPEQAGCVANDIIADRLIAGLCPPDGIFFDIGAHIGSIIASQPENVNVIAFEADPEKAAALKQRFPKCQIFEIALGETEGEAEFFINPEATGYNSLVKQKGGKTINVRVAPLDSLLTDVRADVIKIDIEGAELGALRGGEELIKRSRPIIMYESVGLEANSLGYAPDQIWQWFNERNFEICTPDRLAHTAPGFGLETFLDAHAYPFRTHNYFAIPHEKRSEIRDRARKLLGVG